MNVPEQDDGEQLPAIDRRRRAVTDARGLRLFDTPAGLGRGKNVTIDIVNTCKTTRLVFPSADRRRPASCLWTNVAPPTFYVIRTITIYNYYSVNT